MVDKEKDFKYFLETLINATSKIEEHYFQLPIAGQKNPRFLERVYCYELYHQLRFTLCNQFPYKLNGEVDKNGNPTILQGLGPVKLDFIVHVPRDEDNNLIVIEVKPITAKLNRIKDDLKKLKGFLEKAKYHKAIMFIYGSDNKNSRNKVKSIRTEINILSEYSERIILLWHKEPRSKAEVINHVRPA